MPSFLKLQRVVNVVPQDNQIASKPSGHTSSPFKTQSERSVEPSSTQNPTQINSVFKLLAVIFWLDCRKILINAISRFIHTQAAGMSTPLPWDVGSSSFHQY
jgi:hypothetical protein